MCQERKNETKALEHISEKKTQACALEVEKKELC
jgi:hypothetical protein